MNFLEKLDYMMGKLSINKSGLSQLSGVPYTTIDGLYKKGYLNTKISTIKKIAKALNVSLDYLIDDDIENESSPRDPPQIGRIVENARELNDRGLDKLEEYSVDMARIPVYRKKTTDKYTTFDREENEA